MSGKTYTRDLEPSTDTFNVPNCREIVISDILYFT